MTAASLIICASCGERLADNGSCRACAIRRRRRLAVKLWLNELHSTPASHGPWVVNEREIVHVDPLQAEPADHSRLAECMQWIAERVGVRP